MYNLDFIYKKLKEHLSERRYIHCINVGKMSKELAKIYRVDVDKAYIAGILHDIAKEMSYEEQVEITENTDFFPREFSRENYKTFHGWTSSAYAKKYLNVFDEEILNAIKYHTVGRENMTLLDKIVFTADCISVDRNFEGIEYFRRVSKVNLDIVVADKLTKIIEKCLQNQKNILTYTFKAYNDVILKV